MLSPLAFPTELETSIRIIVAPLALADSFAGSDCQIDLARDGALVTVQFSDRRAPQLAIGEPVVLHFDLSDEIGALTCAAKTSSWRSGAGEQRYEFQIETHEATALAEIVGQRSERRVRINFDNPVRARLTNSDSSQAREGSLFDISTNGCAVLFDAEERWMLDPESPLHVHLDLFPGERPVRAQAQLRSRRLCGLNVVHGYRLDIPTLAAHEERSALDRFLALRSRHPLD